MAKIIKLSNGQVVCYQRKKGSLSCAFGIFVNAGSRDEGKDNNGIAHFIEHMTFKGTEKRTAFEIANELDKLGAHSNAYTSRTNTVYYVGGLGKYFEKYLDVMSDMFFNSLDGLLSNRLYFGIKPVYHRFNSCNFILGIQFYGLTYTTLIPF